MRERLTKKNLSCDPQGLGPFLSELSLLVEVAPTLHNDSFYLDIFLLQSYI